MTICVKGRPATDQPIYCLRYWDSDWEELDYLRLEAATWIEVQYALQKFDRHISLVRRAEGHLPDLLGALSISLEVWISD